MAAGNGPVVGGVLIGIGAAIVLNALFASLFVRFGIYSPPLLQDGEYGNPEKAAEADRRGRPSGRRYANGSRKAIPVGIVGVAVGIVLTLL